jgi:iron complex transport system ATP-binding protein
VQDLCFQYGKTPILGNISLRVEDGELVSLVGPNGAGKSTLLKCLNHILRPSRGRVFVDDEDVKGMNQKTTARLFGYVPQSSLNVFPATVFDTVLLGRRPYVDWVVGGESREIVYEMLIQMDLTHLAYRQMSELSGGEQQRALIARALAQEPRVLLLDEPTSNLDLKHQLEVLDQVMNVVKEKGVSVLMAIHDLNLAAQYSNRLILLKEGEMVTSGNPGEILNVENIRSVYGVHAKVNNDTARPHIIPLSPVKNSSKAGMTKEAICD